MTEENKELKEPIELHSYKNELKESAKGCFQLILIFMALVFCLGVISVVWGEYAIELIEFFCHAEFLCYDRNSEFGKFYFSKFPNWIGWLLILGVPTRFLMKFKF